MNKCKNCGESIKNGLIYCSYKCRNIYVNKYLRDYTKLKEKKFSNELKYNESPKKCKECGVPISYKKRHNIFCSQNCSATNNNKKRVNKPHILSEVGYNNLVASAKKKHEKEINEYEKNPKHCLNCNEILKYSKRKNVFCDNKCKKEYQIKNKTNFQVYKDNCSFKFNLNDFATDFDFSLIEIFGWYAPKNHGNNLNGVSRDHMYSIVEGYKNNIPPEIIAHPANCMLMTHSENASKRTKCSITLDELKNKIKYWNEKYNI